MESKIVYQDDYISITVEEKNNLLIDTWNEKSDILSREEFQNLLLTFKKMVEQSNVSYVISDVSSFMLPMTPELQEWTVNTITIPLAQTTNYSKHAFIMPKEFIANLAIVQFTEDTNASAVSTKYFDNMEEARNWLINSEEK
ncbi:hypothetical protein [Bernardetia sp. MNP-M8]|uniref:hypothetical protein n=1 Tax=Bernardetia sp. MNP-M8 TaxID=3127470 RepID=UPI0030CBACB8